MCLTVSNLFGLSAPVYAGTVPAGAPSTAPAARVDNGSETALRYQRLANYAARLRQEGSVSLVPNTMASAGIPCGAGHRQVAHPGADSTYNPLQVGKSFNPWTRHQEHAHMLSAYDEQPPVGSHYVGEGIPCINAWCVPHYEETSDDDNYQPGFRAQSHYGTREPGLAHPDLTRGCQERRDWYEAPARPVPAPLPRQEEFGIPQQLFCRPHP